MVVLIHQKRQHTSQRFFEVLGDNQRLEMVFIQGGSFVMGSPDDEEGREDNEGPQHEVTVSTFLMGRYPVTQAQWRHVANFDPVDPDIEFPSDPSEFSGKEDSDRRPVERITWYQAKEFCDRLSKHTNRTYRLPSEAEWEYACRAGTTTPFHYGGTISAEVANYWSENTYGKGQTGESPGETTAVDYFESGNAFGLSDMHGNVWEWCQDHWHNNYKDAPIDGRPWEEDPLHNNGCVIRGGSWVRHPRDCRSAYRSHDAPDFRNLSLGFRVVLAPR